MMIKNLIFDVYGTLISTGNGSVMATEKIFAKYRLPYRAEDIYARWKKYHLEALRLDRDFVLERIIFVEDLAKLFRDFGIEDDPEKEVGPMLDSLYNRVLFPDVTDTLEVLMGQYNIAIGSIIDEKPFRQNIAGTVLEEIPYLFTSESLMCYKPSPRFYERILTKTGWKAEETLFVGDSLEEDIIAPKNMGMQAILINRKGRYDTADITVPVIKDLTALPALL